MKQPIRSLFFFLILMASASVAQSQCNAAFTWDQVGVTLQVQFTSTSTSENDIISYQWIFGDGLMGDGQNPSHTYAEPGTYTVCLIIEDSDGCIADVCHQVVVEGSQSDCNASFTWDQVGGSLVVNFTNTSTSDHDIVSWQWTFGDGGTSDNPNPSHTYEESGGYLVCLIIEDEFGCMSDVCHEINVEGPPTECDAAFEWDQVGGTLEVDFIDNSTSNHDIISWHWDFGDGHTSDDQNPLHAYIEAGTYLVCLIIEDNVGCVADVCHEVTVEGPQGCHANFEWEIIGNGLGVHFFSTSTSEHDIISYHWFFGDGTQGDGQNPIHEYQEPGIYHVCLVITDNVGCVSEECHDVTVGEIEGCHASFEWEIIEGGTGAQFFSTSTSEHEIISYQWTFGDGGTSDNNDPVHIYDEPGVYLVCLIITDNAGCVSDVCHEVVIGESGECNASFNYETEEGVVYFNNTSTGQTENTTWFWAFGDGETSTDESPNHDYEEPGVYTVCLLMNDSTTNCSDEYCVMISFQLGWQELHWDEIPEHSQIPEGNSGSLNQNFKIIRYTNPVSDELNIEYQLDVASDVRLELYDLTGYRMISKGFENEGKGIHRHILELKDTHPGLYIISITTSHGRLTTGLSVSR